MGRVRGPLGNQHGPAPPRALGIAGGAGPAVAALGAGARGRARSRLRARYPGPRGADQEVPGGSREALDAARARAGGDAPGLARGDRRRGQAVVHARDGEVLPAPRLGGQRRGLPRARPRRVPLRPRSARDARADLPEPGPRRRCGAPARGPLVLARGGGQEGGAPGGPVPDRGTPSRCGGAARAGGRARARRRGAARQARAGPARDEGLRARGRGLPRGAAAGAREPHLLDGARAFPGDVEEDGRGPGRVPDLAEILPRAVRHPVQRRDAARASRRTTRARRRRSGNRSGSGPTTPPRARRSSGWRPRGASPACRPVAGANPPGGGR